MCNTCNKEKHSKGFCGINNSFIVLVLFILLAIILGAACI